MQKTLFLIIVCLAMLLSFAACGSDTTTADPTASTEAPAKPTDAPTAPTENTSAATTPPVPAVGPFDTENIVKISFYLCYGEGAGYDVPAEYMDEIIAWLATFTVGEDATGKLRPGVNWKHVEITYADGTVIKNGTDTVKIDGREYFWVKEKEPDCITGVILKRNP